MTGMDEQSEIKKRVQELAEAAAPVIRVTAEALAPVLLALGESFRRSAEHARRLIDTFAVALPARRPAARKPCAWCTDRFKRPATHTVKWREPVVWWDEFDGTPTMWPAGRVMLMCEFHAPIAERYNGAKAYRFRRLR